MCKHDYVKFNDVNVCRKCGLTIADGKAVFDRRLPNTKTKHKKVRKAK